MQTEDAVSVTRLDTTGPTGSRRRRSLQAMAIALGVSAGVHLFVVPEHLSDWRVSGIFFVVAGIAQAACAYTISATASRSSATIGAVVSVGLLSAWATSRTVGVPFGPHAGVREVIGALDLLATAAEVVALCAYVRYKWLGAEEHLRRSSPVLASALAGLAVGVGMMAATVLPTHAHDVAPTASRLESGLGMEQLRTDDPDREQSDGHTTHVHPHALQP